MFTPKFALPAPARVGADQALRNDSMATLLVTGSMLPVKSTFETSDGSARGPAPSATGSPDSRTEKIRSLPMTRELKPVPTENDTLRWAGNSRVLMLTCAPEKSPGWSGVNVFEVVTPSRRAAGKRSNGTTFFSGSGLGMRAPLSEAVV